MPQMQLKTAFFFDRDAGVPNHCFVPSSFTAEDAARCATLYGKAAGDLVFVAFVSGLHSPVPGQPREFGPDGGLPCADAYTTTAGPPAVEQAVRALRSWADSSQRARDERADPGEPA
jgi:hypothetical protein